MNTLRIGNVCYQSGVVYKGLQDLPGVSYEENHSPENARKLSEGELDVALVPINALATSGNLVGLDFGVSVEQMTNLIRLVSRKPAQGLRTIYVYSDSSASTFLLRLLASNVWNANPRIIATSQSISMMTLHEDEGYLVRRSQMSECDDVFPCSLDLIKEWHDSTGLPFVFLVWAAREDTLSRAQFRMLNAAFHKEVHAFQLLVESGRVRGDFLKNTYFYLDDRLLRSLDITLQEAFYERIVPEAYYKKATARLFDQSVTGKGASINISEALEGCANGERLTVAEALALVADASLADLSICVKMLEPVPVDTKTVSSTVIVRDFHPRAMRELVESRDQLLARKVTRLLLVPTDEELRDLALWEDRLLYLRSTFPMSIEGFGPPKILLLARNSQVLVRQAVSRLAAAGLEEIPAFGGGLLVDGVHSKRGMRDFCSADWLRVMKWAHHFGVRTSCCLSLSHHEGWEERLLHLQKLRGLQDMNPGFRYFVVNIFPGSREKISLEDRLRAVLIARLFLDNVSRVEELSLGVPGMSEMLGMSIAAHHLRLEFDSLQALEFDPKHEFLQGLWTYGIEHQDRYFDRSDEPRRLH